MDSFKSIAVSVRRPDSKAHRPQPSLVVVESAPQKGGKDVSPARLLNTQGLNRTLGAPMHRYAIGERVKMLNGGRHPGSAAGTCTVVRHLPYERDELQYRVRAETETCERIVTESFLERL